MKCPEEDCQIPASFWHPTDLCTEFPYLNFETRPVYSALTSLLTRPIYCKWLYGPCRFWHVIWVITSGFQSGRCELPIIKLRRPYISGNVCAAWRSIPFAHPQENNSFCISTAKKPQKMLVINLGEPKHLEDTEHPCGRNCIHLQPCSALQVMDWFLWWMYNMESLDFSFEPCCSQSTVILGSWCMQGQSLALSANSITSSLAFCFPGLSAVS